MSDFLKGASPVAAELCHALGLDPGTVRRLSFNLEAGDLAVVEVEYFMLEKQGEEIVPLIKRYNLLAIPEERLPAPPAELEAGTDG